MTPEAALLADARHVVSRARSVIDRGGDWWCEFCDDVGGVSLDVARELVELGEGLIEHLERGVLARASLPGVEPRDPQGGPA